MFKIKTILYSMGFLFLTHKALSQGEPFSRRTVASGLNSPWEIIYGPNDSIWVTESVTYLVKRIRVSNGSSTTLLNLSSNKNFSSGDGGRWPQGGLMGMALHPALYSADPSVRNAKPWVYLAYVYERVAGQNCVTNGNSSNPCNFETRIVRYDYGGNSLTNPQIILDNMPGSNDHNSGRLIIGPDLKLYYTIGDMGAGQFNNASRTNNAQAVDVMEGKILRLNTESDGDAGLDAWVPDDNPFYNNTSITPRDYVYSMGHRNAQGIIWANINGTNRLYNSEHGDKTDDEVNLITAGSNYGWNRVSGSCDDNYTGMTLGGYSPVDEDAFCTATATNRQPIKTLFTLNQSGINALSSDYLSWPTVAPSSIDVYTNNKIPGWHNSLLISCLKAGRVFRVKLNGTGTGITNISGSVDTATYFRGEGRFRDIAIGPDGLKIYMACDMTGQTSGPSGGFNGGGSPPPRAGTIQEFSYTGIVLGITDGGILHPAEREKHINIFPNPADKTITVSVTINAQKPLVLQIYSSTGSIMSELKSTKTETIIDINSLPPGLYFIQVRNAFNQLLKTEKFIKL